MKITGEMLKYRTQRVIQMDKEEVANDRNANKGIFSDFLLRPMQGIVKMTFVQFYPIYGEMRGCKMVRLTCPPSNKSSIFVKSINVIGVCHE